MSTRVNNNELIKALPNTGGRFNPSLQSCLSRMPARVFLPFAFRHYCYYYTINAPRFHRETLLEVVDLQPISIRINCSQRRKVDVLSMALATNGARALATTLAIITSGEQPFARPLCMAPRMGVAFPFERKTSDLKLYKRGSVRASAGTGKPKAESVRRERKRGQNPSAATISISYRPTDR